MKKIREIMRSSAGTAILFALAAVLLAASSVGGARAALIYSQTYSSQVEMFDIGVVLTENGNDISWRDYDELERDGTWDQHTGKLLEHMLDGADGKKETLKLGYPYPEKLRVRNNGTINEYVRVSVYKYWQRQDENGEWVKDASLAPELIDLHFVTGENGWHIDESSSTPERTVLYYDKLLYAEGEGKSVSAPFSDTIRIDADVANLVTKNVSSDGKTTVTTYAYNGTQFAVEARVDAVQEHNADDAIWSTWGRHVEAGDGTIRLAD